MTQFDFIKMHGLGNDFVIIDARTGGGDLDDATVRAVADRKTGIGCDQLIVMEPARMINAAFFMRIPQLLDIRRPIFQHTVLFLVKRY